MPYKTAINTDLGFGLSTEVMIPLAAKAGFDGAFTGWKPGAPVGNWTALMKEYGLTYQSIHAPFGKVFRLWEDEDDGGVLDELISCVRDAAQNGVPIVVVHPIIGMERHTPTERGIERFEKLADVAGAFGVKLAFENVEGIEYLKEIIGKLGDHPAVYYCWDTGHEMCYNFSADVPALYGGRLICTHLNDNLGQSDPEKKTVTWLDDSHLMPFDGVADWQGIADRLDRAGFDGFMTFELTSQSKPERNTHDIYASLDAEAFLKLAHERALRVLALRR